MQLAGSRQGKEEEDEERNKEEEEQGYGDEGLDSNQWLEAASEDQALEEGASQARAAPQVCL